ncbi:MAG: DUF1211 domain-containing protein [Chlorobiaceae bacterium]|nr:DUF1211 domain-containing protein [Chlorobiaceae bacterium]
MHRENETVRIESFSDGVFAIAITLLVIEIKIPEREQVEQLGLWLALLNLWPSYLAFLTSFATILVIWIQHHWIFVLVDRYDHALFYLNGLLLLFVTFIPFPTALLAEYLLHHESRVAANIYTGIFLAISISFDLLWRHVSKCLLKKDAILQKYEDAKLITRHYRFAPLLYVSAFAMSFLSEPLSVAICLLLAFLYALRGWPFRQPI